jgi:hypothetical protein
MCVCFLNQLDIPTSVGLNLKLLSLPSQAMPVQSFGFMWVVKHRHSMSQQNSRFFHERYDLRWSWYHPPSTIRTRPHLHSFVPFPRSLGPRSVLEQFGKNLGGFLLLGVGLHYDQLLNNRHFCRHHAMVVLWCSHHPGWSNAGSPFYDVKNDVLTDLVNLNKKRHG